MMRVRGPILLVVALLGGCSAPCEEVPISRNFAPDNNHIAYVTGRNCGATADFATVVRIGRSDADKDSAQEVFVADSNHGRATTFDRGVPVVRVTWLDARHLHVAGVNEARVFKNQARSDGISISYGKLTVD